MTNKTSFKNESMLNNTPAQTKTGEYGTADRQEQKTPNPVF